ncbi:MAG: hypothetical protein ACR2IN_06165 [Thermoleophilaceae bacterium]
MIGRRSKRRRPLAGRRSPPWWRRELSVAERRTVVIGVIATATTGAAVAVEVGRVWRRGSAPMPREAGDLLQAAQEAVTETVEAAAVGYQEVSTRENALFNLLTSFVASFVLARGIALLLRSRRSVGPFRDVRVGGRHIHHFVPGIVMSFTSGAAAIVTRDERIEPKLAVVFGAGMGLTLDESALLLELEDVYWTKKGLLGVEITLAVISLIGALALGVRFLRRGEDLVLPPVN